MRSLNQHKEVKKMNEDIQKRRTFINLGYLIKVNIDALNSSDNLGGNVVIIKKLQDARGDYYVYVSGQAFRYYLKYTLMQLGVSLTKVDKNGEIIIDTQAKGEERMKYILENHPDLDIFGFMEAEKGAKKAALRRWSPVKVSPLISIFPWKNETDLLTRKKEGQEGGDLVKVEINAFNFMRGCTIINVNEIGSYVDELNLEIKDVIGDEKRKGRISILLDAFKNLNGGGKAARLLDDITPKFLIITKQRAGTPVFLNALRVDENSNLDIELLKSYLKEYKDIIEDYVIGIQKGIFNNEEKIKEEFEDKVKSISEAINEVKEWISKLFENKSKEE